MARIDIRLSDDDKRFLESVAATSGTTIKGVIMEAVKKQYREKYSLYPEYLDLLKRIEDMQQVFAAFSDIEPDENIHKTEFDMYNILGEAEQILLRANAVINDKNLQVYIDDPIELDPDEKPYWRSRFAYSPIHLKFLKELDKRY